MKALIHAVDFGGAPLNKKFAMFDSGLVPMARYRRDMYRFDAVAPQSLRADLFIGQPGQAFGEVVTGDAEHLVYDFSTLDEWVDLLHAHGVLPYCSWCYMPLPVQTERDFRSGPSDLGVYASILEQYAAHYRGKGVRLGYQEVYNEPDCFDVFFKGSFEEYIRMYEVGAPALRRGDADAVVGGPSTAFVFDDETQRHNLPQFCQAVREKELPLDFFSYHSYGQEGAIYAHRTEIVRETLGDDPYFAATELHMNELNAIPAPWGYEDEGGKELCQRSLLGKIFASIRDLAEYTDLTLVHWAQLLDSGVDALGLVDAQGKTRPGYAAFEIFARMPARRLRTPEIAGMQLMASSSRDRVSVVVWGAQEQTALDLALEDLPFASGKMSVWKLDEAFFADYDGNLPQAPAHPVAGIHCDLNRDDVVYIEINREAGKETVPASPHRYVRSRYYFAEREKNTVAFYDEREGKTILSMGDNEEGLAVCASELDMENSKLRIFVTEKDLQKTDAFRLRIDFATEKDFETAVQVGEGSFPELPFAKGTVKAVLPFAEEIDLSDYAPAGWTGRILVTGILKNAGRDSWVEYCLR